MDQFIPEDIRALIERLEAAKGHEYRERKRVMEAAQERERKIEDLREKRRDELRDASARIGAWIENFNRTAGPALWQLLGMSSSLVLFSGKFFRGEPTPPGDVVCSAQLRLGGPKAAFGGSLVYEELHKGQVTSKKSLLGAHSLWHLVHPDFVAQCDAHLAGPDAWTHIRQRLMQEDRRLSVV